MRLISRNDTSLVVGLIAGTIVVFQRPLRFVWDLASEVQDRYHLDLVPALTIFAGVLLFHEYRKRQDAKAEALVAAAEIKQARQRSLELERLTTFGQALSNVLDQAALQQVLWRYVPAFAGEREFWLLARQSDQWLPPLRGTTVAGQTPVAELEAMADQALSPEALPAARLDGLLLGETVCFPMLAGGVAVGVLGIRDGATLAADERKAFGAAMTFVATAVRNVQRFMETREHSLRDGLTNCFNRSHGLEMLDRELHVANRMRQPLSILMFDIDGFKAINDELGHLRGDDLLRAVGAQLTRVLRTTDVRCRYGGDEFLIVLPDTPSLGAQQVAENLRREIAALAMRAGDKTIAVTASFGVAMATPDDLSVTTLVERADAALYLAKRAGKNQSSVADGTPS